MTTPLHEAIKNVSSWNMKKKVGLIRKPKSKQRSKIRVPGLNNSKIIKSSNIKKGPTDI